MEGASGELRVRGTRLGSSGRLPDTEIQIQKFRRRHTERPCAREVAKLKRDAELRNMRVAEERKRLMEERERLARRAARGEQEKPRVRSPFSQRNTGR